MSTKNLPALFISLIPEAISPEVFIILFASHRPKIREQPARNTIYFSVKRQLTERNEINKLLPESLSKLMPNVLEIPIVDRAKYQYELGYD